VQLTPLARLYGLGAIHPAKRSDLLLTRHPPTFSRAWRPAAPGDPRVGRTRIAWQLPLACVLHDLHARQRRS